MFTFDNVPGRDHKVELFAGLGRLLAPEGRLVSLVSSPDIYVNEWASFTTKRFASRPKDLEDIRLLETLNGGDQP